MKKTEKKIIETYRKKWITEVTGDWELEFVDILDEAIFHALAEQKEEFIRKVEEAKPNYENIYSDFYTGATKGVSDYHDALMEELK